MAAPSGALQTVVGSEIIVAAAASTSAITDGSIVECTQDDLQPADVDGAELAIFEFDAAGTFSAAPTAGAVINIYEQKINSDGNDAPDVDVNYKNDHIGGWNVDPAAAAQYFSGVFPINYYGGKYWVEWIDGGAGTASVSAGWELRVTPIYGKAKA